MRFIKYSLGFLVFFFFLLTLYIYLSTQTPRDGTLQLSGLNGPVTIQRDHYGIPHIQAQKSDADVFFALGYVHAQDRLWQMEFQRRVAAGRLSEVLGDKTLEMDKFLRTFGFYRAAKSAYPAFDEKTKHILHSYTQGVNAFLATGRLPLQFKLLRYTPEPWTDIDSFCWQKMMAFDLQKKWKQKITNYEIVRTLGKKEMKVLLPPYPKSAPTTLSVEDLQQAGLLNESGETHTASSQTPAKAPPMNHLKDITERISHALGFTSTPGKGSNNWVVSGRFTASGKPLLANDPHLSLASPSLWYLAELQGPTLHVIGGTLPGLPGVVLGHNDHIAWGVTNVDPNADDLYIESSHTPFKTLHEIIKVKGKPDVDLLVRLSNHGPIISDISDAKNIGPRVALKWVALLPNDTTLSSFLKLNYARNWNDFIDAMHDFVSPSQNFVYADTEGNIGYYVPGKIPLREGWDGSLPVDATQHHEWSGYIPFEALPHALNPEEGYIVSANNKVVPDNYPYPMTFRWKEPPYRAERILDLIKAKKLHTVQTFAAIQSDSVSYLWRDLKSLLLQVHPLDINSKRALELLKTWNGQTDIHSRAATVFNFWVRELFTLPSEEFPPIKYWREPLFIKKQLQTNGAYCHAREIHSCDAFLSTTLQSAVNKLIASQGSDPNQWAWGNVHRLTFTELALGKNKWIGWIWNQTIETPGDNYTVDVGSYDIETLQQQVGPSYRQIIDLADMNQSQFIQPLGQVDDPFNPHHKDFLLRWRDGRYVPMTTNTNAWGDTQTLILEPLAHSESSS